MGKNVFISHARAIGEITAKAFAEKEAEAMEIMGYVVVVQDGWVVKKHQDGGVEKLHELHKHPLPEKD